MRGVRRHDMVDRALVGQVGFGVDALLPYGLLVAAAASAFAIGVMLWFRRRIARRRHRRSPRYGFDVGRSALAEI